MSCCNNREIVFEDFAENRNRCCRNHVEERRIERVERFDEECCCRRRRRCGICDIFRGGFFGFGHRNRCC